MKSTEELVGESRQGNSEAFAELVRRYERGAWTTAWKVLRDHHKTLDATQNAFVEAYFKLSQLRSPSQFGIWLIRIVHREALRIAQRPSTAQSLDQANDAISSTSCEIGMDTSSVITAVGSLPEHERIVVVLRYFNGHTLDQVAQLTGRPIGTVSKQLSRALIRLKSLVLVAESL